LEVGSCIKISKLAYKLELPAALWVMPSSSISQLEPYRDAGDHNWWGEVEDHLPTVEVESHLEYEVQGTLDSTWAKVIQVLCGLRSYRSENRA
jgi:hypothetical protein